MFSWTTMWANHHHHHQHNHFNAYTVSPSTDSSSIEPSSIPTAASPSSYVASGRKTNGITAGLS